VIEVKGLTSGHRRTDAIDDFNAGSTGERGAGPGEPPLVDGDRRVKAVTCGKVERMPIWASQFR
jgi:hypothetical protein